MIDTQDMVSSLIPTDRPSIPDALWQKQPEVPVNNFLKRPLEMVLEQEIVEMVVTRRRASEHWRREKRLIWDKCWDHYRNIYDRTGKENWQSVTFMPATAKVCETIAANLHGATVAPDMPVKYQANLQMFDSIVGLHNDVISNDFQRSKFKVSWADFVRTLCILGTAVGKIDYEKQIKTVMVKRRNKMAQINPILQRMGMPVHPQETFTAEPMVTKDWAKLSIRDLYDIYPEPYSIDIGPDNWIIEKAKITNAELIAGANDPDPAMRLKNVNNVMLGRTNDARVRPDMDPEKMARRLALMQQSVAMHYLDPDIPHELLEYWGPVPLTWLFPDKARDPQAKYQTIPAWLWVIDGQWVVRSMPTPLRDAMPPYVRGHYIRIPGQWYGVGPAELMIGLQIEKNELRNTRIDNVNLIMNKVTAVLKDKVPPGEWNRLKSAPGALWLLEGIDDIRKAIMPVEYTDMTKDVYLASAEVDREIQETTAAVSATLGVGAEGSDSNKTFRGQLLNKQSSTERFMLYARGLEVMGLGDCLSKYYQRIYQFKDYDSLKNIMKPEDVANFEFIPPEQLEQYAKIVPMGVMTMESKGVKLAQMEAFTNQWKDQFWFKGLELARKEWVEMNFPNPDQVLFSDEEMDQYNQAKQAMLASMPPGTGGPGGPGAPAGGPGAAGPGAGAPGGRPMPNMPGRAPIRPGSGQPIAGNTPMHTREFGSRPALPARGPGASSIDQTGRPIG